MVETQEYAATIEIVSDLEEQAILEAMLDGVKPTYAANTENLHYLISTPFRYAPLEYGSRFGSIFMDSFFYGSEEVETTLAETAYYRFVFYHDMKEPYSDKVTTDMQTFSVQAKTVKCADLTTVSTPDLVEALTHKSIYGTTQALGKQLVEDGVDVIRFCSARINDGVNVAIAKPKAIKSKFPNNTVSWICQWGSERVSFNANGYPVITFTIEQFLVDGSLPNFT